MGKKNSNTENKTKTGVLLPTRMIPDINSNSARDYNDSYGEMQVYKALRAANLSPENYTVFYSVKWSKSKTKKLMSQYETDFVILHRELGMLVIEVKTDRLAWKDGKLYPVDLNGNIKKDANGNDRETMDPMAQSKKAVYNFFNPMLKEIFNTARKIRCQVEPVVWLTSMDKTDDLPADWGKRVLFKDALKKPKACIDKLFKALKIRSPLDEEEYKRIIEKLAGASRTVRSLNAENEAFLRLTEEQYFVLNYMKNFRELKIQGSGGTGKTLIALEKARRLAETLPENKKILVLCFNTMLQTYLAENFNANRGICEKIDIYTSSSFVNNKEIGWNSGQFWKEKYLHFIIDEAQDQHNDIVEKLRDHAREIAAAAKKGAEQRNIVGVFYAFYDSSQFVQGARDDYPEWLKSDENAVELTVNCRNTGRISETSGKLVNVEQVVKGPEGSVPDFFICQSNDDAKEQIVRLLDKYTGKDYNCSPEDICILSMKVDKDSTSVLYGVKTLDGYNFTDEFREWGKRKGSSMGSVLFTTVRKFKGLEAKIVIIVDVVPNIFTADARSHEYKVDAERQRKLFYVGASRAKNCLDVIFVGDGGEKDVVKFADTLRGSADKESLENLDDAVRIIQKNLCVDCEMVQHEDTDTPEKVLKSQKKK